MLGFATVLLSWFLRYIAGMWIITVQCVDTNETAISIRTSCSHGDRLGIIDIPELRAELSACSLRGPDSVTREMIQWETVVRLFSVLFLRRERVAILLVNPSQARLIPYISSKTTLVNGTSVQPLLEWIYAHGGRGALISEDPEVEIEEIEDYPLHHLQEHNSEQSTEEHARLVDSIDPRVLKETGFQCIVPSPASIIVSMGLVSAISIGMAALTLWKVLCSGIANMLTDMTPPI